MDAELPSWVVGVLGLLGTVASLVKVRETRALKEIDISASWQAHMVDSVKKLEGEIATLRRQLAGNETELWLEKARNAQLKAQFDALQGDWQLANHQFERAKRDLAEMRDERDKFESMARANNEEMVKLRREWATHRSLPPPRPLKR